MPEVVHSAATAKVLTDADTHAPEVKATEKPKAAVAPTVGREVRAGSSNSGCQG
jgi:hypothetical protein